MRAPELDQLNKKIGEEFLSPKGFVFENGNWHFISEDYQLSFVLGKDKNASYFQIKYLTLCVVHFEVPEGDDIEEMKIIGDLDRSCPIQVSPFKLKEFVESEFNPKNWRYHNAHANKRHPDIYCPLYYGGLDKWVMKDRSYSESENREALKRNVEVYGADLIDEDEAENILRDAIVLISEYGKRWAEYLRPEEVVSQITKHGDGWWVENNWVELYRKNF